MSFLDHLKETFNLDTVEVKIDAPGEISRQISKIEGTIIVTAKSLQSIKSVSIRFVEDWRAGIKSANPKQEPLSRTFDLGGTMVSDSFVLQTGEQKILSFSLPFTLIDSNEKRQRVTAGNPAIVGTIGTTLDQEKSEYRLEAAVTIAGAPVDAAATLPITFI